MMNVYEIGSLREKLASNPYPGRGIVLGMSADGKTSVAAYFIMGRSVNSRNRVFLSASVPKRMMRPSWPIPASSSTIPCVSWAAV